MTLIAEANMAKSAYKTRVGRPEDSWTGVLGIKECTFLGPQWKS